MAASNWLRDGAEATRRRQRALLAVAASVIAIPATILILATIVAQADSSSRPLAVDASVAGTVTRASNGTGVNQAVVSARSLAGTVLTTLSASNGAYAFAALPPGDYVFHAATTSAENLAGQFSGGATTRARAPTITLTDGASLSAIDFSLQAAGGISGFVTDSSDDSAVSGVRVTARRVDDRSAEITAVSDSAGAYRISFLAPGNYIVRAVPPASTAFSTQIYDGTLDSAEAIIVGVEAGEDTEGVDFALETGVDVSGTVRSASGGLGASGAVVTASEFTTGEIVAVAIADSTGAYVLPGVPAGSYRLHARPSSAADAPNLVPAFFDDAARNAATAVAVSGGPVTGKDFDLAVGGTISGTVSRASGGSGVAGVYVLAAPGPSSGSGLAAGSLTDASGRYSITGLPAGDYLVDFQSSSPLLTRPQPVAVTLSAPGVTATVNLSLIAGGSISGTVSAATGGTLLGEALVTVEPLAGGAARMVITQPDGTYEVNGLAAGDYRVRVDAPDLAFVTEYFGGSLTAAGAATVAVTSGVASTGIDIALDATGSIKGTVSESGGGPISALQVTVASLGGVDSTVSTDTDIDGTYEITGLAPGEYRVSAPGIGQGFLVQFFSGASSAESATPVVVSAGAATTGVDFVLSTGGKISGTVTRASGGTAVEGASVLAIDEATGAFNRGTTGSDGMFEIVGLVDGSYLVSAEAPQLGLLPAFFDGVDLASDAAAVVISAGGTVGDIDFALTFTTTSSPGSITGVITSAATGNPVGGATIRATGFDGGSIAIVALSAADGTYSITGLPPDDYRVEAHALDQGLARRFYDDKPAADGADKVTVSAGGATSSIDIALEGS